MSGHSKWSTIKRAKEATDKQRGKLFSKFSKEIAIAARSGADPKTNFKLRLAIEKAKTVNMPKDNIQRALQKGSGQLPGEKWEELTLEGYGPMGIGVIIEAITDSKNRTTAEIKNLFERGGGTLTGPGAVSFLFKRYGFLLLEKEENIDEQILKIMDLGVADVSQVGDGIEVWVDPEKLSSLREEVLKVGFKIKQAELVYKPTALVTIEPGKSEKVIAFMEALEVQDDVQKVYANFDINQ